MIEICIDGRPVSKKNSKQIFRNNRTGRVYVSPSDAYQSFRAEALRQIYEQWQGKIGRVIFEYSEVEFIFYQKGKLSQDVDNAMSSMFDIFQEAGLVEDDKFIHHGRFDVVTGAQEFKTIIRIHEKRPLATQSGI